MAAGTKANPTATTSHSESTIPTITMRQHNEIVATSRRFGKDRCLVSHALRIAGPGRQPRPNLQ